MSSRMKIGNLTVDLIAVWGGEYVMLFRRLVMGLVV